MRPAPLPLTLPPPLPLPDEEGEEEEDDDEEGDGIPPILELSLPTAPLLPPVAVPEENAKVLEAPGLIVTHNTSIGIGQFAQLTRISGTLS
jgi:hypothetical protein